MAKWILAFVLCFQFSFAASPIYLQQDFNAVLVSSAKITANYESFLNLMGLMTGQSSNFEKLKQKIGKQALRSKLPKMTASQDGSLSVGADQFTFQDGGLFLNGTRLPVDASKDLVTNYNAVLKFIENSKTKSSLFSFIIPMAHAEETPADSPYRTALKTQGFVNLILGVGLAAWSGYTKYKTGVVGWTPLAIAFILISNSTTVFAADGVIPTQVCTAKNGGFRNSFQDLHKDIFTQDYSLDPDGNLLVVVKRNGDIESTITVSRKGEDYKVLKIMDKQGSRPVDSIPAQVAKHAFDAYKTCSDPDSRQEKIKDVEKLKKAIDKKEIELAQDNLKKVQRSELEDAIR